MSEKVKEGDTVAVKYTGKLASGKVFDSNEDADVLSFQVGAGVVIPGFDQAVLGLGKGESRTVEIAPEDAYGPRRDELMMDVDKGIFQGNDVEPGMQVDLSDQSGQRYRATVVEIQEEKVRLDLNHQLAGETLTFDVRVEEIERPS